MVRVAPAELDNLPTDPSQYLDKIKEFINNKNLELGTDAKEMNQVANKLQENIDSVVFKIKNLEDVQTNMTETIANNDATIKQMKEELTKYQGNNSKQTTLQEQINLSIEFMKKTYNQE